MPAPKSDPKKALAEAERRITECRDTRAQVLRINELGLHEVPESLRTLGWLTTLDIQLNHLTHLPHWLGELKQLRNLFIFGNPLKNVLAGLGQLAQLEALTIGGSSTSVEEDLGSLQSLRVLGILGVGLTQVPEWIRRLRNLQSLTLFGDQLTALPEWLGELTRLERLDAQRNCLRVLPASLLELKSLHELRLEDNPELGLPVEILKSGNTRKILDYYFRAAAPGASKPLNEFKLVLVGRGGVGKTTLVHRLVKGDYKEFKRTPGIKITQWPVKIGGNDVRAHVWDFGGQEIMHGTHR